MRDECREAAVWGSPQLEILSEPSLCQPGGRFVAKDSMKAIRSEWWFEKVNLGHLLGDDSNDILASTSTNIQQIHTCLKK